MSGFSQGTSTSEIPIETEISSIMVMATKVWKIRQDFFGDPLRHSVKSVEAAETDDQTSAT